MAHPNPAPLNRRVNDTSGRRLSTAIIEEELSGMGMTAREVKAFNDVLHPDDGYDHEGTYWADLPLVKRAKFVTQVNNAEAKQELGVIWRMFKKDPLSPISAYFRTFVIPGMGLGLEGFVHPFVVKLTKLT